MLTAMVIADVFDPTARSRALADLLLGDGQAGTNPADAEARAWAQGVVAAGRSPRGWDPASLQPGWQAALANAGVPLARGGEPWTADISETVNAPMLLSTGNLVMPPLASFMVLTSMPLKPLRLFVHAHLGTRLQVATGVHLWVWENQLILVNTTLVYRGGFMHGPQRGMRSVVALEPGQSQEITW